jgi:hypothetical protein
MRLCRSLLARNVEPGDEDTVIPTPLSPTPGFLGFLQEQLLQDTQTAKCVPTLAPLMLTVAAALTMTPPPVPASTASAIESLSTAAEDAGVWAVMLQLLSHEGLQEGPERRFVGDVLFHALGIACTAFGLRVTTLPGEDVEQLLKLLDGLLYHDLLLSWYAALVRATPSRPGSFAPFHFLVVVVVVHTTSQSKHACKKLLWQRSSLSYWTM